MTVVREFHEAFGLDAPNVIPCPPSEDLIRLRMRLVREEFDEVMEEFAFLLKPAVRRDVDGNLLVMSRLLKELCDLRYVVEGAAVAFGLPIDAAYAEVHRSNMSKLGANGKPIYDAGGKVMKGPGYSPANMDGLVPPVINHKED